MDGLRWLLLLFGLLVIAGVYLYSRRASEPENDTHAALKTNKRLEPSLNVDSGFDEQEAIDVPHEPSLSDNSATGSTADEPKQKVVTLRIVASGQSSFAGDELALCLRGIGLRHGKFGIYHRYDGIDEDKIIFSVASLVEPGSFELSNLKEQNIPGISLFMVLPGPTNGPDAFDLMMVAARALAQSLNGEMLDESGSSLSIQREHYMRDDIVQFQISNRID